MMRTANAFKNADNQDQGPSMEADVAADVAADSIFSFAGAALGIPMAGGFTTGLQVAQSVGAFREENVAQPVQTFRPSAANDTSYTPSDLKLASGKYNSFTMYQAAPVVPDMAPAFIPSPAPAMRMGMR